ncbi:S1 family peptidase [Spirillospora sp. CA-294931]|uniref:S1 family peptidase n=1 Tax=Spirillospora sp. CA-294931 TaxID=3240042 RepID=UPI003D8B685D
MIRSLLVLTGTLAGTLAALAMTPAPQATAVAVYDVRGGDSFTTAPASGRCTVGFSVQGGYVTTGKCGSPGATVIGYNGVAQGTMQPSTLPGGAGGWVKTNTSWRPRGLVNRHDGTFVAVRGSQAAPVGSAACMAGATSGWKCGTIQARNVTVNFPEGTLTGLIRASVCAAPGDLGAPLVANGQAQGVLVGSGGGGCPSYFYPVDKLLSVYGLTLVTE